MQKNNKIIKKYAKNVLTCEYLESIITASKENQYIKMVSDNTRYMRHKFQEEVL